MVYEHQTGCWQKRTKWNQSEVGWQPLPNPHGTATEMAERVSVYVFKALKELGTNMEDEMRGQTL